MLFWVICWSNGVRLGGGGAGVSGIHWSKFGYDWGKLIIIPFLYTFFYLKGKADFLNLFVHPPKSPY